MTDHYLRNHKRLLDACEQARVDAVQARDECKGGTDELRKMLTDSGIREQALRMENERLRADITAAEQGGADPMALLSFGACGAFGVMGGVDLAAGNAVAGYTQLGAAAVLCVAGLIKQATR